MLRPCRALAIGKLLNMLRPGRLSSRHLRAAAWRGGAAGHGYSTLARRTSLMTQFQRVKDQFSGYVLLFQVGDFYELYGEDANEVASRTNLRLTRKSGVSMAGFPVRSLDEWQRILVEAGLRLAVCNQHSVRKDTSNHGLMEREVVRLVTAGTLTEPLGPSANYLLSIAPGPGSGLGLAWCDVSTAELRISSADYSCLDEDIERISPSEVLLPTEAAEEVLRGGKWAGPSAATLSSFPGISRLSECHVTPLPTSWYSEEEEEGGGGGGGGRRVGSSIEYRELYRLVKNGSYSALERSAVFALLRYIGHTHRHSLPALSPPSHFTPSQHLAIDASTRRSLELIIPLHGNSKKTTLLGCMDQTVTAAGSRLLRSRMAAPLTDPDTINRRLDSVEVFCAQPFHCTTLHHMLRTCADLERVLQKVATGSCSVAELRAIKTTLSSAGSILRYIQENIPNMKALGEDIRELAEFPELVLELDRAIGGHWGGHIDYISKGYSTEVDSLRDKMKENEQEVETLATQLQERTGIQRLAVISFKGYHRVFELTQTQAAKTGAWPELVRVDSTQTKARFMHGELQQLNVAWQQLECQYTAVQEQVLRDLCDMVMDEAEGIRGTAAALSKLDVATSLGMLAEQRGYTRPHISTEPIFKVTGSLHPVLSSLSSSSSSSSSLSSFVSNDCTMESQRLWVVTGPNMGGKSTFLRQNALIQLMAQMGSFVPAQSATVGVADRLFARVGASDNVARHMSTFQLEMSETANIIAMATNRSFVVLDEIGRGTATDEGVSIAIAVVEYLHNKIGCRALIATHFPELSSSVSHLVGAGCCKLVAERDGEGIVFTYRVQPGQASCSFGIEVAQSAGIPTEIIERAKELLSGSQRCSQPNLSTSTSTITRG